MKSPHGRSQRFFNAPASLESVNQCGVTGVEFVGPVLKALGLSVQGKPVVVSSISGLLIAGFPGYVARFVRAIIVSPFQAMLGRWSRSHILIECLERLSPAVAHCDSTTTPVLIANGVRVVAPLNAVNPNVIFGGARHTMDGVLREKFFSPNATAAWRVVAKQSNAFCSTIAPAQPHGYISAISACIRENSPSTVSLASEVCAARWAGSRIGLVHQKNLPIRFGRWIGPGGSSNLPLGPFHYSLAG